jgi:hypothetical protein
MPDRYFFGGRLSRFVGYLSKVSDGSLYEWHRFGPFHYVVPVAIGGKHTLKLYFLASRMRVLEVKAAASLMSTATGLLY